MADFKLGNASGNPWTGVSPNQTASTMSAWEAQFNASVITNIERSDFRAGNFPWFNVKEEAYGATGDGVTDDLSAIQSCIDACEAVGGGTVYFPPGDYIVSGTLTVQKPIILRGTAMGLDDPSPGSADPRFTTIQKKPGSTVNIPLVAFSSATASNWLSGVGIYDIAFILNGIGNAWTCDAVEHGTFRNVWASAANSDFASYVVRLRGTRFCEFSNVTLACTKAATSLYLDGENAGNGITGCTQNKFHNMLVTYGVTGGSNQEGGVVLEGDVDNNEFYHFQATNGGTAPATSGTYGVVFKNSAGSPHPRMNNFYYLVGSVKAESSTIGNRILHMTAEASEIDVDTGAIIHYSVVDNNTRGLYQTPMLAIRDRWRVDPAQMTPIAVSGTSALAAIGAYITDRFAAMEFPDSATDVTRVGINTGMPLEWGDGNIVGCIIHHAHASASSSAGVRVSFKFGTTSPAEGGVQAHTVETTESFTIAVDDSTNVQRDTVTFGTPFAYTVTNTLEVLTSITLERDPTHVDDDLGEAWQVLALTFLFEGAPAGGNGIWEYGYRGV